MKKRKVDERRRCPKCGKVENQINKGKNRSGTRRCRCLECEIYYTPEPKRNAYSEELREKYFTDGWSGYVDVVYPGEHVRNVSNKNDTFTVESVNADLRHYIPILARRSRCFPRKLETLRAVIEVFADAYNALGVAKMKFRKNRDLNSRELPFSLLDFI